jgi:hypothetical protein
MLYSLKEDALKMDVFWAVRIVGQPRCELVDI